MEEMNKSFCAQMLVNIESDRSAALSEYRQQHVRVTVILPIDENEPSVAKAPTLFNEFRWRGSFIKSVRNNTLLRVDGDLCRGERRAEIKSTL
jgi:hypothetical protein